MNSRLSELNIQSLNGQPLMLVDCDSHRLHWHLVCNIFGVVKCVPAWNNCCIKQRTTHL